MGTPVDTSARRRGRGEQHTRGTAVGMHRVCWATQTLAASKAALTSFLSRVTRFSARFKARCQVTSDVRWSQGAGKSVPSWAHFSLRRHGIPKPTHDIHVYIHTYMYICKHTHTHTHAHAHTHKDNTHTLHI